ncbi:MAG: hypothetical protein WC227_01475 [Patescibacteria group bacterium]|jgi:hypothetical protein
MNYFKNIIIILASFLTVLFDVAFFSNFQFFEANVLSCVAILFTLAIFDKKGRWLLLYALSTVFFFAILSSLPLWVILLDFLLLPVFLNLIRRRFFPEPNVFTLLFFSIPFLALLGTVILASATEFSFPVLKVLLAFVVANQVLVSLVAGFYLLVGNFYLKRIGFIKT